MLLNNFLYQRSLIKNELYQEKEKFSIIVPKSTFNNIFIELFDFEKKEHQEEIKEVTLKKGGDKLTELGIQWSQEGSDDIKERVKDTIEEEKLDDETESLVIEDDLENDIEPLVMENIEDDSFLEEESPNNFNKDIIFDNLKPSDEVQEGGDIKNVVVSFF
tara:strand:- start:541 stop:1023 length:483 start_codon:yes stop_codon:yes gene_type:complete